jgi:hypothetical protein
MPRCKIVRIFAVTLFATLVPCTHGQQPAAPAPQKPHDSHAGHTAAAPSAPAAHEMKPAHAADVASPDAILAAFYASLSGAVGQKRDIVRFSSLFYPGAQLMPAEGKGHGTNMPRAFAPSTYIANTDLFAAEEGYLVKEIARRTERFGKIAQVFSTYGARHAASDPKPFVRGVNSFQLFFDGHRWWILSLAWQTETPDLKLPEEYLR